MHPTPTDKKLSRIIKITVYGFKIIGLAPLSIQRTGTLSANRLNSCISSAFLYSKFGLFYNILLSILISVMGLIAIPESVFMTYPNKSFITQSIDVLHGISRTSSSCIVILFWAMRQESAASIANRLLEINCLLSGMKKNSSNRKTSLTFFAICTIFNASLWVSFWVSVEISFSSFPSWFVANLPLFVINWFVIEYSIVLGVVARALETLNKNLLNLKEFPYSLSCTSLLNDCPVAVQSLPFQDQLTVLLLLRTTRTSLYDVSSDIARFFSFPVLPCIACFFFTLVYNIYYLITPVVISVGVHALTLTDDVNTFVWIGISFFPLILLAINVTETSKEVQLTGTIVHKLLAVTMKHEIKLQLKQFSYELLHENVSFTAYGFFALDFTLIQSILGATATYLVIIIQFMRSAGTTKDT